MLASKTFQFNGVEYDTIRFLTAQGMFKKITPEQPYAIHGDKPPLISDEVKLPIVLQYEGRLIAVALPSDTVGKEATETEAEVKPAVYRDVRLVTKHNLKSFVKQEPVTENRVEELERAWQPPRRDGYRSQPYQPRARFSSGRY